MTHRPATLSLFGALMALALAGCGGSSTPGAPAVFNPDLARGTWAGNWTNQSDGTSGTAQLNITMDNETTSAIVVVTLTGNALGSAAPAPFTLFGTYNSSGATFTNQSPVLGRIGFTIDANGRIAGSASGLAQPGISSLRISGSVAGGQMTIGYLETATSGSGASGIVSLTRQQQ